MTSPRPTLSPLRASVAKKQSRFKRLKSAEGKYTGVGEFFFLVDIAALGEAVYVPLSIASSKKPTGFVYHIEGTKEGGLLSAEVSVTGAGVKELTLGTLRYAYIPAGKTASFRIPVSIQGRVGSEYNVVIQRIHYKRDISAVRYEKLLDALPGKALMFR